MKLCFYPEKVVWPKPDQLDWFLYASVFDNTWSGQQVCRELKVFNGLAKVNNYTYQQVPGISIRAVASNIEVVQPENTINKKVKQEKTFMVFANFWQIAKVLPTNFIITTLSANIYLKTMKISLHHDKIQ